MKSTQHQGAIQAGTDSAGTPTADNSYARSLFDGMSIMPQLIFTKVNVIVPGNAVAAGVNAYCAKEGGDGQ